MAENTTLRPEGAANYILADTFSIGAGSAVSLTLEAGQQDEAALTLERAASSTAPPSSRRAAR